MKPMGTSVSVCYKNYCCLSDKLLWTTIKQTSFLIVGKGKKFLYKAWGFYHFMALHFGLELVAAARQPKRLQERK